MAHFYDSIPEPIRKLNNSHAIDRYAAGAEVPGKAIAGLSSEQLRAFPVPGTWSIQQIFVHLTDSDLTSAYRMKRIIAEEKPTLDAWDQSAFVAKLDYHNYPVKEVCEVFRLNRAIMVAILRRLPDAAFERVGIHPEIGPITLGQILRIYVNHVDHHMAFLKKKREMLGSPL
jgi:uncharacterized damage-inducible protein DinB